MKTRIKAAYLSLAALLSAAGVAIGAGAPPPIAGAQTGSTFTRAATSHQLLTGYSPAELASAYDYAPLYQQGIDGTGQTVALIEVDKVRMPAVRQFDAQYNLPAPKLTQYYVGGAPFQTGSDGETTLDVEWLHALAPGAAIQIYYMTNADSAKANWAAMGQALRMAAANGAATVSISLGTCGPGSGYKATSNALAALVKRGISVFVASGDYGDRSGPVRDCGRRIAVSYPASDPSVVAVGGTSLQLNPDNSIASEIAWSLSGGGVAKKFARPTWQVATGLPADTHRWVPDVSFLADPETGVSMYFHGRWITAGGTSLGAPAWAAAWSLVRAAVQHAGGTVGAAPKVLYAVADSPAYSSAFHDITEGSNGKYNAGPGWNAVTGLGTPDVAKLVSAVETQAG